MTAIDIYSATANRTKGSKTTRRFTLIERVFLGLCVAAALGQAVGIFFVPRDQVDTGMNATLPD